MERLIEEYDITWEEVVKICRISLETNTDPENDLLIVCIRSNKIKGNYTARFSLSMIRDREMMSKITGNKETTMQGIINDYIKSSGLNNIFGKIKV